MATLEGAYCLLEAESMDAAKRIFVTTLRDDDYFNVRLGLQACYFNSFLGDGNIASLNLSVQHGRKALHFNDNHFDVHCMLAQAYATRYFELRKKQDGRRALFHYEQSTRCAYQRVDLEPAALEQRLEGLMKEIVL